MSDFQYSKLDEKIDNYLGTTNLRPGPPKRLVNKLMNDEEKQNKFKKIEIHKKNKINYCSESIKISKNLNWNE